MVGFDIPCAVGDALWRASPEELTERVRPALERAGLAGVEVLGARVRRMGKLSGVEGLYPVGRSALFVHDNVHHACAAGLAVGRMVAEGASSRVWRGRQGPFLETQIED